ncbi:MAG: hypothetical protein HRT89_09535 [Lentisphaeria bacterium]|nr:hypothetical protein [Lentisphaeria bacterium]
MTEMIIKNTFFLILLCAFTQITLHAKDMDITDMHEPGWMDELKSSPKQLRLEILRCRSARGRKDAVKKYGGLKKGQQAVNNALKWLAGAQNKDGSWESRPAHTGMALMVFLAHGETEKSETYGKTVELAIKWLHKYATGTAMKRSRAYSHGIATQAIADAYILTQIPYLKTDMEKCLQRIIDGQQNGGGFDYNYKKGARWDMSVSGWQFQALKACQTAAATNPGLKEAIQKAIKFCKHTSYRGGKFGYSSAGTGGNMTGLGTVSLQIFAAGKSKQAEAALKTIEKERGKQYSGILEHSDTWKKVSSRFLYGWYYDTQAMFNKGGDAWKKWRKAYEPVLIKAQDPKGYWETSGGHGMGPTTKGRILSTCWVALQLEVYYRYLRD